MKVRRRCAVLSVAVTIVFLYLMYAIISTCRHKQPSELQGPPSGMRTRYSSLRLSNASETVVGWSQHGSVRQDHSINTDAHLKEDVLHPAMTKNASSAIEAPAKLKYILYWNEYYGRDDFGWGHGRAPFEQAGCAVSACFGTSNRRSMPMNQFDAILFHVQTATHWPRLRSPHQRYVFVTKESPSYLYTSFSNFNNWFNWTMTYSPRSDFPLLYGRVVRRPKSQHDSSSGEVNYAQGKSRMAAWFVSNCRTRGRRERYVQVLRRYMEVDIYGRCGRLECPRDQNLSCHDTLLNQRYKFYLAFENSLCDDYVTEKFFNALKYNVVPIVMGGANYSAIAPPGSYINALEYTPKELADYLYELHHDDSLYNSFFRWKGQYDIVETDTFARNAFCDLCERLHTTSVQTYPSIHQWWMFKKCRRLTL